MGFAPRILGLLALAGLTACAYQDPGAPESREHPFYTRVTWFSYVGGDDIRQQCLAGAPERYRLIYNGIYGEQVRTYDVVGEPQSGGALMSIRVLGSADVGGVTPQTVLFGQPSDAPTRVRIDEAQLRDLASSMDRSGYLQPAPAGLRLPSRRFYWVASGCRDGIFKFNAWRYPSERFNNLKFPIKLASFDPTGIPFNPPIPVGQIRNPGTTDSIRSPDGGAAIFELTVAENGLVRGPTPF